MAKAKAFSYDSASYCKLATYQISQKCRVFVQIKLEPIMLLVLPIIPCIIFTHYTYFIPMPLPIIPDIFFTFLYQ